MTWLVIALFELTRRDRIGFRIRRPDALEADDFRHDFLKDRRCDLGTIVDTTRIVYDDEDDILRVLQRAEAAEGADILAFGIARTILVQALGCTGLAAELIAFDFCVLATAR